jgi:glycosyltransferase involved in cell wall biosynthesis
MWNGRSTFCGASGMLSVRSGIGVHSPSASKRVMRILFVNSTRLREGGVETYIETAMAGLTRSGHEVSLCHELDWPYTRKRINVPPGTPTWCVADLGMNRTLDAVRQWRPDVIYSQNVGSIDFERELLKIAPAVFFAHAYYGTCISGSKAFRQPLARPCHRQFGWQCLLQFYPKRCGGLNPATMVRLYRHQTERLQSLRNYRCVVTHSDYLRSEYVRHGVPAERVFSIPYCVAPLRPDTQLNSGTLPRRSSGLNAAWRLAFAGRMDDLKGGLLLLQASRLIRAAAARDLHVVMAGDGPQRQVWESAAAKLSRTDPGIRVDFAGWLEETELGKLFHSSDLLVVPSVWPEPLGIVGIQAALEGVPAAAFAVGGIPVWLADGKNGHLASGEPPTPEGLAAAIVKCLADEQHYLKLCRGAVEMANRFSLEAHLDAIIRVLEMAAA